ncbi:MAG: hypothetical protein ACTSPI_03900 [Candidatus Heimdallarchaeaceae archaeon]
MELEIFIHDETCENCKSLLSFMSAVINSVKSNDVKLIVHQANKGTKSMAKYNINPKQLPVIVLPSGCKIGGSPSHDLIGTLACSLISNSKVPVQSVEKFELDKKEGPLLIELTSAIVEYQAAYTLRRERSYTFIIRESTKDVPIKRYEKLSEDTTLFLMTNFESSPSPKLYEFGLKNNVFLGHIIRDNITLAANLIVWRNRANHITYFRVRKDSEGNYVGTCSSLLGDGKKMIKTFYKPLFLTSSTVNVEGNKGESQNRIVANIKEVSAELDLLLKK